MVATYLSYMSAPRPHESFVDLFDAAAVTGTLTTIATGGVLLGIGWRAGEVGRVFRLSGRALLAQLGYASSQAPLSSVALGYLHHLTAATIWGFLLALFVLPWRGAVRVIAAIAVAAIYVLLVTTVVPAPLRIGYGVTGNMPGVVLIAAAMAVAFLSGAWVSSAELRD